MAATASSSHCDLDSRSLQVLLEAFGSRFSVDDIAAAYCQASCNVDTAGEILSAMIENTPNHDEVDVVSGPEADNVPQDLDNVLQEDRKTKVLKPKKYSVSMGTIASVIGKDYVTTRPLTNGPHEATKPVKIDSKNVPATAIWSKEMPEGTKADNDTMQADVEEFLLKMLGEGFQVDSGMIHEVLGMCGYDVQKIMQSMEKLLDLSDSKKYAGVAISTEKLESELESQGSAPNHDMQQQDSSQSNAARFTTGNSMNLQKENKAKTNLEREVLEALFSVAERFEKDVELTRMRRERRRSRVFGKPVVKPFEEPFQDSPVVSQPLPQAPKEDEHGENGFEALRKAANEHWITMKEYYKAAVEAFMKGEVDRADRLLGKGHFFRQKARDADEKSTAKLVEIKNDIKPTDAEEEVLKLDVHDIEPREALRLLKLHLTKFSGISCLKYLIIIVGISEEDIRSYRKRLMVKLLEKESIVWTEENNGLKMIIRVDEIDPKSLSFAKK